MTERSSNASSIDERNKAFWNELCGTQFARKLGVVDATAESLRRFDNWYFDYYPYLERHIPFGELKGRKVLEVGLGYGSVAQRLAESGADYHGLDIAEGPVAMANHRLRQSKLPGEARQASILQCPFPDSTFDWVVAIGCYHHTGDLQTALDETWRVLRPRGKAIIMVYNAYSYRRWVKCCKVTCLYFLSDKLKLGQRPIASERDRELCDTNCIGSAAPETEFVSGGQVRSMAARWQTVTLRRENIGNESLLRLLPRNLAIALFGPSVGLDLYCHLVK